ncbi:MAG: DUF2147 domain-containing protein [Rhodobacteraceae bacterium]|nr:DUF2147 domain-containing protein [Paracoccaceae bacterium]
MERTRMTGRLRAAAVVAGALALGMAAMMAGPLAAQSGAGTSPAGLWQTEAGEQGGFLHVRLARCGAEYCGTIERAFDRPGAENRGYAHLGKPIIWGMEPRGAGNWRGGRVWAPDQDRTYNARMEMQGPNALSVSGCVLGICRAQVWQRLR